MRIPIQSLGTRYGSNKPLFKHLRNIKAQQLTNPMFRGGLAPRSFAFNLGDTGNSFVLPDPGFIVIEASIEVDCGSKGKYIIGGSGNSTCNTHINEDGTVAGGNCVNSAGEGARVFCDPENSNTVATCSAKGGAGNFCQSK